MYTGAEAIQRGDLSLLHRTETDRLLTSLELLPALIDRIECSDIPAGFMGEDEAHEPLVILRKYEPTLLSGNKADRALALRNISADLREYAQRQINSAACAMEEWTELTKAADRVTGALK